MACYHGSQHMLVRLSLPSLTPSFSIYFFFSFSIPSILSISLSLPPSLTSGKPGYMNRRLKTDILGNPHRSLDTYQHASSSLLPPHLQHTLTPG